MSDVKHSMLLGHEDKIEVFKSLVKNQKLGHAYLFFGDNQIGKFTFAKSLAYFLEYGEFGVFNKPLIDSQEISPDLEKNTIGIDAVRQIKRFLYQKPFSSQKRTTIIDQAQALTPEAQAGLLKIVEEPPSNALIIIIAQDPLALLPPLLSRLRKVYFRRLSSELIEKNLQEHYKISKERARKIANLSFGRMGRAIDLLKGEEDMGNEDIEYELEKRILDLRKNLIKNSHALSWLLEREMLVKRYNLNKNLQQKAINVILNNESIRMPRIVSE